MRKNRASDVSSQLKSSLKQLRKLGLYNPKNARKAPTRYAKSLVKQYSDVLGAKPRVEVVKVPAKAVAALKGQYRVKRSKKGAVAIVPKAGGMKAGYSKKHGTIVRRVGEYQFIPIADNMILMRGEFPKLRKGQAVAVRIGNNYQLFYSIAEVRAAMGQYDPAKSTLWQYPYLSATNRMRIGEDVAFQD